MKHEFWAKTIFLMLFRRFSNPLWVPVIVAWPIDAHHLLYGQHATIMTPALHGDLSQITIARLLYLHTKWISTVLFLFNKRVFAIYEELLPWKPFSIVSFGIVFSYWKIPPHPVNENKKHVLPPPLLKPQRSVNIWILLPPLDLF